MLMFVVVWSSSLFSLGRSSFDMRVESSSSISLLVFVVSGWLILRGMTNGSGGGVVVFFNVFFGGSCAGGGSFSVFFEYVLLFRVVFCVFSSYGRPLVIIK